MALAAINALNKLFLALHYDNAGERQPKPPRRKARTARYNDHRAAYDNTAIVRYFGGGRVVANESRHGGTQIPAATRAHKR
jgi:hypothetical protein